MNRIKLKKENSERFLKRYGAKNITWVCDSCSVVNNCEFAYDLYNQIVGCSIEKQLDDEIEEEMKDMNLFI